MPLAIIQLVIAVVGCLEGEGGDVVRQLLALAEKQLQGTPLTADELAYVNQQREAAVQRMDETAKKAIFEAQR